MDPGVAPWYAELASTDGLDVCKGGVLFVVLVVEDLVVLRNYVFFSTSFPLKLVLEIPRPRTWLTYPYGSILKYIVLKRKVNEREC